MLTEAHRSAVYGIYCRFGWLRGRWILGRNVSLGSIRYLLPFRMIAAVDLTSKIACLFLHYIAVFVDIS